MPVVRSYQRQIGTAPLPSARRGHQAIGQLDTPRPMPSRSAESYGAGFAQAGQNIALDLRAHEIAKQDQIRALQVERKLSDWELGNIYDREHGALTVLGEKSYGLQDTVGIGYDKAVAEATAGLNDRQKRAVEPRIQARRQSIMGTITTHAARQGEIIDAGEFDAFLKNHAALAVQSTDGSLEGMHKAAEQVQSIRDEGEKRADRLGLPKNSEDRKDLVATPISAVHVGVIQRLLDTGQVAKAKVYFEEHRDAGEIQPAAVSALEKALTVNTTKAASQQASDQIKSFGGIGQVERGNLDPFNRKKLVNADGTVSTTLSKSFNFDGVEVLIPTVVDGVLLADDEAIAEYRKTGKHFGKFKTPEQADVFAANMHNQQARQIAGLSIALTLQERLAQAGLIEDADVRDATEARVRQDYAAAKEDEQEFQRDLSTMAKQRLDQIVMDAKNSFDRGAAFDSLPQAVRDGLPIEVSSSLQNYAAARGKRIAIATDPASYATLRLQAGKDPAAFAKVNLNAYLDRLDAGDWKQLVDLQGRVLDDLNNPAAKPKAAAELDGIMTNNQRVEEVLRGIGLDPDAKANAATKGKLMGALDKKVLALQAVTGKPVSDGDKQKILDDLVILEGGKKGGWLNILPGGEPFFDQPGVRKFEKEEVFVNPKTGERLVYRGGAWVKP